MAIGDRHLENLMVRDNGQFFHLDFGYMLGKEPPKKGKASPIRVNNQIISGFGGRGSEGFKVFRNKTIDAFLYLRNYRHLMINIMLLMVDAGIGDLPKENYKKILTAMNERFLPNLSNEEARTEFTRIIDLCIQNIHDDIIQYFHYFSVTYLQWEHKKFGARFFYWG